MITMVTAWYGRRTTERKINKHRGALCGYLGCGQYATRVAWDRHYNLIDACPDPAHGTSVAR